MHTCLYVKHKQLSIDKFKLCMFWLLTLCLETNFDIQDEDIITFLNFNKWNTIWPSNL